MTGHHKHRTIGEQCKLIGLFISYGKHQYFVNYFFGEALNNSSTYNAVSYPYVFVFQLLENDAKFDYIYPSKERCIYIFFLIKQLFILLSIKSNSMINQIRNAHFKHTKMYVRMCL